VLILLLRKKEKKKEEKATSVYIRSCALSSLSSQIPNLAALSWIAL